MKTYHKLKSTKINMRLTTVVFAFQVNASGSNDDCTGLGIVGPCCKGGLAGKANEAFFPVYSSPG